MHIVFYLQGYLVILVIFKYIGYIIKLTSQNVQVIQYVKTVFDTSSDIWDIFWEPYFQAQTRNQLDLSML